MVDLRSASMFLIFMILSFCLSCATVLTGTRQDIRFDSRPEGADILINGIEKGSTPVTLSLKKPGFSETRVTLRMKGYKDQSFTMDKEFNAISLISLIGILPAVVDLVTGAFVNYGQLGYDVKLKRERARTELGEELGVDAVVFSDELQKNREGDYIVSSRKNQKIAVIDVGKMQAMIAR